MNKIFLSSVFLVLTIATFAQTEAQKQTLEEFSKFLKVEENRNYQKALQLAVVKGWPLQFKMPNGGIAKLVGVYANGMPEYTATDSNVGAANSTNASTLWNGGTSGLNLSGSSAAIAGKLGIWDGGAILGNHQELVGKIQQVDAPISTSDHGTHVAGTMVAKGISPFAKGMVYDITNLKSYDFNNDNSEMASAASGLLLSNHSYGAISGWRFNGTTNVWEFWGEDGTNEDYKFGYYDSKSRYWDSISFLSPNYLIVKSAGNKRNENGPQIGTPYSRFNAFNQMLPAGNYPGGISSNDGYDIIPTSGTAKNILTVGAVGILNNGYGTASNVVMSSFSSWGPTDDGRIKPDIVGAGVNVTSTVANSTTAYDSYSGTSMSAPNVTGSLTLLQELYNRETTTFMRSATLKALAIHTANEAGNTPGPDYQFGWGLLDVKKASDVIMGRNASHRIVETSIAQSATYTNATIASGNGPLLATIVWTDPASMVFNTNYLNNRTAKLVNDLDLRITSASGTELPWKLDVNNPALAATKADNTIDNVERIEIANAIPGQTYTVTVNHKGTLVNATQNFSLILSGVGGTAYCTSSPNSNANTRIDNVTYGGINRNGTGCTQYTNATNLFASAFPGQVQPFSITLGTCGSNMDKMAKIFIDWNSDGDFVDANELCATSAVISGTGIFSGTIATPSMVVIGNASRIRVVVSETTDASTIQPCGTYAFGETIDLSIRFVNAVNDGKAINVFLPESGSCANDVTFVAATVQNIGSATLASAPVKAIILDGTTVVATLLDTCKTTLLPNGIATVYFRNAFISQPGKIYTIKVNTDVAGEQVRVNDTVTVSRTIAAATSGAITNGTGQLCTTNLANLSCTAPANANVFWYTSATGGSPIATGTTTTTNTIPANRTFYVGINDAKGNVGPINKNALGTSGANVGYAAFSNVMNITVNTPLLIESARMYFGNSGSIDVLVKDASGTIVAQTTVDVLATTSTPGSSANDVNDTGRIVPLNLRIPNAGNYTIGCNFNGGATSFRHNPITGTPYPFVLPSLMSITGSNNGTGVTTYYWFYDMRVKALGCASTNARTVVVADNVITPAISQSGTTLTSSEAGTGYQWYLEGNPVASSNSQSITITAGGNYTVAVFKGGCTFTSAIFNAVFTSIQNVNAAEILFVVTPNPVINKANASFRLKQNETVALSIISAKGEKVSTMQFMALGNTTINKALDVSKLKAGTYFVVLAYDGKQSVRKITVIN